MVHYWFLYGILTAGEILFWKSPANDWPKTYYYGFAALWSIFQLLNLKTHIILRNLRIGKDGKVDPYKRGIPSGFGFDTMLNANYTWEILGWVTYTIMTKSWFSLLFTVMGALPMFVWAKGKKRKLLKYYKDDEKKVIMIKKRSMIFPGIY